MTKMNLRKYLLLLIMNFLSTNATDIKNERVKLLEREALMSLGGHTTLNDNETIVNTCLMQHKFNELDYAFDNPQYFNLSQHYFKYKDNIVHSKVYKIIKDMPKGAALHIHDMGILGPDYLMNLTYMDHLYVRLDRNAVQFKFANNLNNGSEWMLLSEVRKKASDISEFDARLRRHFSLVVDDPDKVYPSIKDTWTTFMEYYTTVIPLVTYRPIWEQYFYDVLKAFREQNILYVEVRSILPKLYELNGDEYDPLITAEAYKKATDKFVKDHPDFVGAKLIYAPSRKVGVKVMDDYLKLARRIKQEIPELFAGFDIVGQEDLGKPLEYFASQLSAAKDLDFFFHAGETDWYGTSTDINLVDAILLGAKRIGHAYALTKHPVLVEEVIKRDIGLEVNVISNEVLSLVKDIRNHPLSTFIAQGLPVVLSSDDPGVWEADPISHDYYVAFVGAASKLSDLKLLKTLAVNSLKYSALKNNEKAKAVDAFNKQWNRFIDTFDCSRY